MLPPRQRVAKATAKMPPRIPGIVIAEQEGVLAAWKTLAEANDQDVLLAAARTLANKAIEIAGTKANSACELMAHITHVAFDRRSDTGLYGKLLTIHDDGADKISESHTHVSIMSIGRTRRNMSVAWVPNDPRKIGTPVDRRDCHLVCTYS
ncbi:MAG: hypothetical protein K2Q32_06410 [Alphaproteobacteria bacterium]|nr:hypothetical protein [Alphaproteobacteria bacterium]